MTSQVERVVHVNKTFAQLKDVEARYIVSYGGRRSSKSVSHSQLNVRRGTEHKRHFLVMRKVARSLRLSCWPRYKNAISEVMDLSACKVNKSEQVIELPNETKFTFVGADDVDKLKSIEGITDVVLEEANEFDELDFDTVDAGLSANVDPPPQITLIFNPIPFVLALPHWLQRRWVNAIPHELSIPKIVGDVCILRSWYKDNFFCPPATIRLLEGYKLTNPQLYRMWALGEFTKVEGAILTHWDVVDSVPEGVKCFGLGLDFGFSGDPAALVRVWQSSNDIWLQELIYDWDLTNDDLCERMAEVGVNKLESILADSAEPKSIEEIRRKGWLIGPCDKGPDYKRGAIRYLQGFAIHVLRGSSNLVGELSAWCWLKNESTGKFLPKIPDGNDHAIDATIYRAFTRNRWGTITKHIGADSSIRPVTAGLRGTRF